MVRRSLRQSAADTPLARWLVEYGESRGWETGRQAAKYLGVKQAAFSTWLRGEVEPSRDYQEQLAEVAKVPVSFVADLVRQTKALKQGATGVVSDASANLPARELIRLTVLETIEQMDRRRQPRVPTDDPVLNQMVSEINAALAEMTVDQVAEARHCFREELQRHRRGERERASNSQ